MFAAASGIFSIICKSPCSVQIEKSDKCRPRRIYDRTTVAAGFQPASEAASLPRGRANWRFSKLQGTGAVLACRRAIK
jgi:hypothetical protein